MMNAFVYTQKIARTVLVLSLLVGLGASAWAAKKQQYYEMRIYRFKNEAQKKVVEDYWRTAAIPALNRLGVSPVGVFDEADQKDGLKLYVLLPYKSLDQVAEAAQKLAKDATYQQAAAAYLNAEHSSPAYDRIESSLMLAFKGWPEIKVPTTAAPRKERIYEFRLYESFSEKSALKKIDMFNEGGEIKVFERLGFNPVYFGQTIVGAKQPHLTYMTSFDNKESRDQHWKAFSGDPEWKRVSAMPEYANTVSRIEMHFLTPTDYSQI